MYFSFRCNPIHTAGLLQGPPQGEPRRGNRTARPSGKVPGRAQVEKSIRSQTRKGRSEKPAFFIAGRFFAEIPVICAGTGFTALFPSCLPAVHPFPAFHPMIPPSRNMGIYIEMRITATRRPTRRIRAGSSSDPMRLIRNSSSSVSTSP